jgi:hypothetical protein
VQVCGFGEQKRVEWAEVHLCGGLETSFAFGHVESRDTLVAIVLKAGALGFDLQGSMLLGFL